MLCVCNDKNILYLCVWVVLTIINNAAKTGEDVNKKNNYSFWYSYSSLGEPIDYDARIVLKTLRSTGFFLEK